MSSFANVDKIKFIKSVQRRPVLYAIDHKMYRDRGETFKAWNEVAKTCNIESIEKAKALWSSLRSTYIAYGKSSGKKKCRYVEELSFLQSPNFHASEKTTTIDDEVLIIPKFAKFDNEDDSENKKGQFENYRADSYAASSSGFAMSNNDTNVVTATCSYGQDNVQDDLTQFFNSLCLTASKFPPNVQRMVKLELLKVINNAEEQIARMTE